MTRHPAGSNNHTLIIGGGASGLAAACVAQQLGQRVTLLEARDKLGKKLLATGNGRCNLMHLGEPVYFGHQAFAQQVLTHCPRPRVSAFFEALGLLMTREGDLAYPASLQATSVLDVLLRPLQQPPGVDIRLGEEAVRIAPVPDGFEVHTRQGQVYRAGRVIAAAGSPAQPRLSGADSLTDTLRALGHRAASWQPALTALMTDARALKGLKGLRVPALCTLANGRGQPVAATEGEVLFAQDAVSGVCVMQLSRAAGQLLHKGETPTLYLDFSPLLGLSPRAMRRVPQGELTPPGHSTPRVLAWLQTREATLRKHGVLQGRTDMDALLLGALPRQLISQVRGQNLAACARTLSAMPFEVRALRGFDHAQVAAGGIDPTQVDPATMRSLLVPGLFITGELLDVDGDCGGHNLLFAWATGILAGSAAAG